MLKFSDNYKCKTFPCSKLSVGWLGEAKVSCILHHWGVQLILAYSWARPAILAAGVRVEGGMFLFFLFLHFCSFSFLPCLPLSFMSSTISSISLLPFSGRGPTRIDVSLNPYTINQSKLSDKYICIQSNLVYKKKKMRLVKKLT